MARTMRNLPDTIEIPASWQTQRKVKAGLELTKTTTENARHWKGTDALSPRAAYPRSERKVARERSRYEAENNSWYAGMLRTAANHIVGTGPRLQVLTDYPVINARIERYWRMWAARIRFAEKLRTAVMTYWRDGEVFGLRGSSSQTAVGLDVRLYEGDQVAQPLGYIADPTLEDGKRIDNYGNMVEAWIFDRHPGDVNIGVANFLKGEWYPADRVWHLFRADRPGQVRGLPRCSPGLDWLAHLRRYAKATLSAAELHALMPVFATTNAQAGVEPAELDEDFYTIEYWRGLINFMPEGWKMEFPDPKFPTTTNEQFQRTELMYFARCANMPYSLAAGTSKDANFSAAKMDIVNLWGPEVRSEQDTLNSVVMIPTFRWFLEDCIFVDGVLDDCPLAIDEIDFRFDWPPLPVADEIDAANAAKIRMESGQTTGRQESMAKGEDHDAKIREAAKDYGVTVEQYKAARFAKDFATPGALGGDEPEPRIQPNQVDYSEPRTPAPEVVTP